MIPDLNDRIYNAQCFGNVEPVEFMVPYPNIFSLVDGQNVKFKDSLLYKDIPITNKDFLDLTNRAASWLTSIGGKPESRIFLPCLDFPYSEILAFGIWNLGATVVLTHDGIPPQKEGFECCTLFTPETEFQEELSKSNPVFTPTFKPNLLDEALILLERENGIRLSHYNLLVNANGIQKSLQLNRNSTLKVNLKPHSPAWVVLQVILPLYTGTELTSENADTTLSLPGQFENPDYLIQPVWNTIEKTDSPTLHVLPENSGILCINNKPIHLTQIKLKNGKLKIIGHSVMMGYLNNKKNEKCFFKDSLNLEIFSN